MRKFFQEFREFAMRGSVVDLAIGVIIGAAFGKIITSLVNDIIMPLIGILLGPVNFQDRFIALDGKTYASLADAQAKGAPTVNWGLFINNIINFIIVALIIFMVIRWFNHLKDRKPKPEEKPTTKECPYCISTIPIAASRCPDCTSELKPVAPSLPK